jgi:hypothetical protein
LATIIKNIKIRPLDMPFSMGFVQSGGFAVNWIKINNKSISEDDLEEIERRYLIPYNVGFKNIYL